MDIYFDQTTMDIEFVDGDFALVTQSDECLQQRLFIRFKTFSKDCFWNIAYGIDYLNNVFGMKRPKSSVDLIIRNEILKEEMVAEITSFESSVQDYNYSCTFRVKVIDEPEVLVFYLLTTETGLTITDQDSNSVTVRI